MVRYIENKKMFFRKIKEDNNKIEMKIKENIMISAEFNDNIPLIYNVIS